MLNKARKKFIIWAMVAMTVVVAILIAAMNIVNWKYTDSKLNLALEEIVDARNQPLVNDEKKDDKKLYDPETEMQGEKESKASGQMKGHITEENKEKFPTGKGHGRDSALNQYAGRLSIILLTDKDEFEELIQEHELLARDEAEIILDSIKQSGKTNGYYNGFRYTMVSDQNKGTNVVYALDSYLDISAVKTMVWISILVGAFGLVLAFAFILKMSKIAVAPVKESIEKQKQFITNAGHELKTPISAISTNMEILSMDMENNEWVEGTKRQTVKLRKLVENLVSLSKLEEEDNAPDFQSFNISRLAEECIDGFQGIAEVNGKTIITDIAPDIKAYGDASIVQQLIGILCDNAIKYSVGDRPIEFRLFTDKKHVCFQSINDWDRSVDSDKLDNLFERFYRGDTSRTNNEKSAGYGLGLSIARAMAEKNHGNIEVRTDSEGKIVFTVKLNRIYFIS